MSLISSLIFAYGFTITDVLNSWSEVGVFAYALPFLMIFAMIFGILNKTEVLGTNKGVQATIALAVGLMSLQFDYVADFFSVLMPYLGVGISIILAALILMGLIVGENRTWPQYIWFIIGIIVFIVVVLTSFNNAQTFGGFGYWVDYWPAIIAGLLLIGLMALIIWGNKKE
ncbi:MAG: hypothetical protein ACP5OG_04750 [Candidatus Nanoarchaeia archaeon]